MAVVAAVAAAAVGGGLFALRDLRATADAQ